MSSFENRGVFPVMPLAASRISGPEIREAASGEPGKTCSVRGASLGWWAIHHWRRFMLRSWMLGGVGGLLLASVLWGRPGTVKTKDGQTFEGDIAEQGDLIIVDQKGIHTSIARDHLRSITYSDSIEQEYRKRLAKLTQYDVPGRLELAQWLFERKSYDLAQEVLRDAEHLQPHNAEVAQLKRTVERQAELDQSEARRHAPIELAAAGGAPPIGGPAAGPAPAASSGPTRLVTPEEMNLIAQKEWQQGQLVRPNFRDDVRRKYIGRSGVEPVEFNRLTPPQQAWAIVQNGTTEMKKDVIISDPPALLNFKKVQTSLLSTNCANCHSGERAVGTFSLHLPADNEAATYTNFLILQKYNKKIGDRLYSMIDRERPADSLLLSFLLPPDATDTPHPKAQNYHGAVRSRGDIRFKSALDWISSLTPLAPDYGDIDLNPKPPVRANVRPATRPAPAPGK
jgi:hypothetical protein